jgi:hypothetical protein
LRVGGEENGEWRMENEPGSEIGDGSWEMGPGEEKGEGRTEEAVEVES